MAGLFFFTGVSSVSAANCEKSQDKFSFSAFLNPIASLAEKVVKGFGYNVALATAPDPDTCGSDSGGDICISGVPSPVTISWTAAPSDPCSGYCTFSHYTLTIPGVGSYDTSGTSYTISSGLANSTTYTWSVDAFFNYGGNFYAMCAGWGFTDCPSGSFTTSNCASPASCPASPAFSASPSSINSGQSSTLSWGNAANATSCSISPTVGSVSCSGGSASVSPTQTTTYTFTASNSGGSCSPSPTATVTVVPKYKCSSGSCVQDANGTFTTSNCDNSCSISAKYKCAGSSGAKYKCSGSSCVQDNTDCVRDDVNGTYTTSNCDNACGIYTTSNCDNACGANRMLRHSCVWIPRAPI